MADPRRRIPRLPQYQPAEKEPAKVQAALDAIAKEEEDEEEEKDEQDEEFVPNPTSVPSCHSLCLFLGI